jgi:hypothetical protein
MDKRQTPTIEERIQHALTDARVVLPGAQALLGFQLIGVFFGWFRKPTRFFTTYTRREFNPRHAKHYSVNDARRLSSVS